MAEKEFAHREIRPIKEQLQSTPDTFEQAIALWRESLQTSAYYAHSSETERCTELRGLAASWVVIYAVGDIAKAADGIRDAAARAESTTKHYLELAKEQGKSADKNAFYATLAASVAGAATVVMAITLVVQSCNISRATKGDAAASPVSPSATPAGHHPTSADGEKP